VPGFLLAGRYRIAGFLGRGGMGEVYRVDDLKLGETVALKFLPEELAARAETLELFLNEVRTAHRISHSNVCRVHDVGEAGGRHFLSMEYVTARISPPCCGASGGCRATRPCRPRARSAAASPRPTIRASCTATSSPPTS